MHPRTIATLDRLEKAAWFSCVGLQDTTAAIVLLSWVEAIEHCGSINWRNLLLEAANQYCERLVERSTERFEKWNEIVAQVKKVIVPFVSRKMDKVIREQKLPKVFEDVVRWDMIHICMEAEYADVYPPGFYASQGYWYVKGHFPCGWQGKFPAGKLIIY
jgi:hypothetical protein